MPKVVTRQRRGWELNSQPAGCKSNALATRLPSCDILSPSNDFHVRSDLCRIDLGRVVVVVPIFRTNIYAYVTYVGVIVVQLYDVGWHSGTTGWCHHCNPHGPHFPQIDIIGAVLIVWRVILRENYEVCFVQYCVQKLRTVQCTHI